MNTGTLILKKKIRKFALGGGVVFNNLAISGDWNTESALLSE